MRVERLERGAESWYRGALVMEWDIKVVMLSKLSREEAPSTQGSLEECEVEKPVKTDSLRHGSDEGSEDLEGVDEWPESAEALFFRPGSGFGFDAVERDMLVETVMDNGSGGAGLPSSTELRVLLELIFDLSDFTEDTKALCECWLGPDEKVS
ncbi:hypothetical protein LTR04_004424, partial [Oleoguttula sp. CCFEE 6159]